MLKLNALFCFFFIFLSNFAFSQERIAEGSKKLQVAYDVDIVIAGGSTYAVTAAISAAEQGAKVFLTTDRPYLGEDLCQHMDYFLTLPHEDPLIKKIWAGKTQTTPLQIKKNLDSALLKAGVQFLTGSYPAEVLLTEDGQFGGITMHNRSGRQVVRAKVLIDATEHATLARQTKIPFSNFVQGDKTVSFKTAGAKFESKDFEKMPFKIAKQVKNGKKTNKYQSELYDYKASHPFKSMSWGEFSRIEHKVRSATTPKGTIETSEALKMHFGIRLKTPSPMDAWDGLSNLNLESFYHSSQSDILVLGQYANINEKAYLSWNTDRKAQIGRKLGAFMAGVAKDKKKSQALKPIEHSAESPFKVSEKQNFLRSRSDAEYIEIEGNSLPILGEYDVVVVGGGTSGAPAAIGSAEKGAKTLLIEYLDELGGVGTAGLIGKYWYGLRNGFTARIDKAIQANKNGWDVVKKSEWMRRQILQGGGDIWYRSYGCGALVKDRKVEGVVVVTPFGRGIVKAKVVIDGTGNSDIPAHAGGDTQFSIDEKGMFSVQLAGYPHRTPGDHYNNSCYALVDDCDAIDVWQLMLSQRSIMKGSSFDAGQLLDSRDRRRIIGDYTLTTIDILTGRTFPDTIVQMKSNFDSAKFPNSKLLLVKDMKGPAYVCSMPYRCFIPRGLEGLYSIGLGASTDSDAMTLVRMQPDLQNQGYAVGVAAAMAAENGGLTRNVDIKSLQKNVIKKGIIPMDAYSHKDSFPIPESELKLAVEDIKNMSRQINQKRDHVSDYPSLAKVMSSPENCLPLLKEAFKKDKTPLHQLNLARIMMFMGEDMGVNLLIDELNKSSWDKGYGWTMDREHKNTFTDVDRLVLALGYSDNAEAAEAIYNKIQQLKPEHALSHYLALSYTLRNHPSEKVYPALEALMSSKDSTGYVQGYTSMNLLERKNTSKKSNNDMNAALKEMTLAGMMILAGDKNQTGKKVLNQYKDEIGGHYVRYAESLLSFIREK